MPHSTLLLHTIKLPLIRARKHLKLHRAAIFVLPKQRIEVNLVRREEELPPRVRAEVVALRGALEAEGLGRLGAEDDHVGEVDVFVALGHVLAVDLAGGEDGARGFDDYFCGAEFEVAGVVLFSQLAVYFTYTVCCMMKCEGGKWCGQGRYIVFPSLPSIEGTLSELGCNESCSSFRLLLVRSHK